LSRANLEKLGNYIYSDRVSINRYGDKIYPKLRVSMKKQIILLASGSRPAVEKIRQDNCSRFAAFLPLEEHHGIWYLYAIKFQSLD